MGYVIILAVYFTPLIIAVVRKLPNTGSVAVINILLGWTIVGWVVALAMACGSGQPRGAHVTVVNNLNSPNSPANFAPVPSAGPAVSADVTPPDSPEVAELREQLRAAELRNKIADTDSKFYAEGQS